MRISRPEPLDTPTDSRDLPDLDRLDEAKIEMPFVVQNCQYTSPAGHSSKEIEGKKKSRIWTPSNGKAKRDTMGNLFRQPQPLSFPVGLPFFESHRKSLSDDEDARA